MIHWFFQSVRILRITPQDFVIHRNLEFWKTFRFRIWEVGTCGNQAVPPATHRHPPPPPCKPWYPLEKSPRRSPILTRQNTSKVTTGVSLLRFISPAPPVNVFEFFSSGKVSASFVQKCAHYFNVCARFPFEILERHVGGAGERSRFGIVSIYLTLFHWKRLCFVCAPL